MLPDGRRRITQKDDADSFIESSISEIREIIGDSSAIVGVSGGVDSTVAAVLVHRAIGNRLHPIMVTMDYCPQRSRVGCGALARIRYRCFGS